MFSPLRNRFGIPGVISVIALVFAMLGGAYAASDSSGGGKATSSAKAKRGPKGPKGATGPAGPAGPAGAVGPAGAQGPAGANGKDGAAGPTGPTGATGATGAAGAPGLTGFTETLPEGMTETGVWHFNQVSGTFANAPISFPIPLATPLPSSNVHLINEVGKEITLSPGFVEEVAPETSTDCVGTVAAPTAKEGHLCVYITIRGQNAKMGSNLIFPPDVTGSLVLSLAGAGTNGARVSAILSANAEAWGSWAVTAEE